MTPDDPPIEAPAPDPGALLHALRASLGGADLRAVRVVAEVTRIDPGQATTRGEPMVVCRSTEERRMGADGDQSIGIDQRTGYPYAIPITFREEVADGVAGRIVGADTFGGDRRRPMPAARLAARDKQRLLATPAWLAVAVEPVSARPDGDRVIVEARWNGTPVSLLVDAAGTRLDEVRFTEEVPPLGEVEVVVRYDDWRGTPPLPYRVRREVDGGPIVLEVRSAVEVLPELAVEVPPVVNDAADAAFGWRHLAWIDAWLGFSFPQDEHPGRFDLRWDRVADGVSALRGEFHNVTVVELGDGRLAMIEAPHSPALVEAALAEIALRWPEATVVAAALTHHHHDHAGGIAAVAAHGVPLYVPAADEAWVRELLGGAGTVVPVADRAIVEGPLRTLELVALPNAHADDLLVGWVPAEGVVHVADLLNPGLIPTRGPYGWLARRVIAGIDPYNLVKAGTYAASLGEGLDAVGIDPRRLTGGHGPQVARRHALRVLSRSADPEAFRTQVARDMAVPE